MHSPHDHVHAHPGGSPQHGHDHVHAALDHHHPVAVVVPARVGLSLLTFSALQRLAGAGVIVAGLWAVAFWAVRP